MVTRRHFKKSTHKKQNHKHKNPSHKKSRYNKSIHKNVWEPSISIPEYWKLEFPYRDLYVSETRLMDDFDKLKNFKPKKIKMSVPDSYRDHKMVFVEDWNKNQELYEITDYFSQRCRAKCIFNISEDKSVLELFTINKSKILQSILRKRQPLTYYHIREEIFKNHKQCTNFNTTLVVSFLQLFKPKRWLDFSAGWGDRLIGGIAYGCEYTGVDPSECQKPVYQNIINTLVEKKNRKKYQIISDGFENVKVKKGWYDLVFTSPPFFDFELYEDTKKQSTEQFKNVKAWKEDFLFPCIRKSRDSLTSEGYLALYITDFNDSKYIDDMMKFVADELLDMTYLGNLYWINEGNTKKKRTVYVWQKDKEEKKSKGKEKKKLIVFKK